MMPLLHASLNQPIREVIEDNTPVSDIVQVKVLSHVLSHNNELREWGKTQVNIKLPAEIPSIV